MVRFICFYLIKADALVKSILMAGRHQSGVITGYKLEDEIIRYFK